MQEADRMVAMATRWTVREIALRAMSRCAAEEAARYRRSAERRRYLESVAERPCGATRIRLGAADRRRIDD